jgi:ribosomal protein L29
MKIEDIKKLGLEQINTELEKANKELIKINLALKSGQSKKVDQKTKLKALIARLKTEMTKKQKDLAKSA